VRTAEGVKIPDAQSEKGYLILCPQHMPEGSLDPVNPPEASKLPSIHADDRRYER
jgi:hypothetical protein